MTANENVAKPKGIVIGFEGGDGSGKTGTGLAVKSWLESAGYKVARLPIIEGSEVGAIYRKAYTQTGLPVLLQGIGMLNAVLNTLHTELRRLREENDVVILDRTLASFAAYQLSAGEQHYLRAAFEEALKSDPIFTSYYTVYLEVSPENAMKRLNARGNLDLIEQRGESWQRAVQAHYEIIFDKYEYLRPWLRVNTNDMNTSDVTNFVYDKIKELL